MLSDEIRYTESEKTMALIACRNAAHHFKDLPESKRFMTNAEFAAQNCFLVPGSMHSLIPYSRSFKEDELNAFTNYLQNMLLDKDLGILLHLQDSPPERGR